MSEYGRDESAPTPGGVFRGYFVGVRCIINNPFAAKWQAVSSRRGPIYRIRVHEYPEIILRIYAVGITIRIISTYQNHLGCIEERAR